MTWNRVIFWRERSEWVQNTWWRRWSIIVPMWKSDQSSFRSDWSLTFYQISTVVFICRFHVYRFPIFRFNQLWIKNIQEKIFGKFEKAKVEFAIH